MDVANQTRTNDTTTGCTVTRVGTMLNRRAQDSRHGVERTSIKMDATDATSTHMKPQDIVPAARANTKQFFRGTIWGIDKQGQ